MYELYQKHVYWMQNMYLKIDLLILKLCLFYLKNEMIKK
jgi:hypothetical protein